MVETNQNPNQPIEEIKNNIQEDIDDLNKRAQEENIGEDSDTDRDMKVFTGIALTVKKILEQPEVSKSFVEITNKLRKLSAEAIPDDTNPEDNPADISKELTELITTSIAFSVWSSISHYDESLKSTLENEFQDIASVIRKITDEIVILRRKVSDLEKANTKIVTVPVPDEQPPV